MNDWISVKDRLPDKKGEYLVVQLGDVCLAEFPRKGTKHFQNDWGSIDRSDITHWMPLPEPPKHPLTGALRK